MIDTYGVKKMSAMDYYRVFQEVQSAKQLARTHMKTQYLLMKGISMRFLNRKLQMLWLHGNGVLT